MKTKHNSLISHFGSGSVSLCILFFLTNLCAKVLTYDEAVDIALNKSYTIQTFKNDKQASLFYYQYYKALFKPRVDMGFLVPSWNESVVPIQQAGGLPVYNSTGSFQYQGDLTFTFMLPTGGNFKLISDLYRDDQRTALTLQNNQVLKSSRAYTKLGLSFEQPILTANRKKEDLKMAEYFHQRSTYRFTREQMNIIYEVTRGFYSLYRATRLLRITEDQYANAVEAFRIAQIKEKNGRIPQVDVLISQVDMFKSEAESSERFNDLEREKDRFKHLIGMNMSEDIQIITDVEYDTLIIDLNKAIETALKFRMELKEMEINNKMQEIEVDRAKRTSELSGVITAYYDFTGVSAIEDYSTQNLFESSFDNFVERDPNRGITVSLSYPLFDWGRKSARVQERKVRLKNSQLEYDNQKVSIIREVRDIVRSLEESHNRLKIYKKNQEISELTYYISQKRFENGDINSQELAIEQESLAQSQKSYLDAYISYQLASAELKRITMWDFKTNRSYLEELN